MKADAPTKNNIVNPGITIAARVNAKKPSAQRKIAQKFLKLSFNINSSKKSLKIPPQKVNAFRVFREAHFYPRKEDLSRL